MKPQKSWRSFLSTTMVLVLFCSSTFAAGPHRMESEEERAEKTYVQSAISCAKTCLATFGGALTTGAGFLGLAGTTCTAGVCPIIAATSTGGVLTASGLGAAVSAFVVTAGEVCGEGISLQCMGYVAVPAVMGGVAGYLIIKGYDKARKWQLKRQAMAFIAAGENAGGNEESDDGITTVAGFVPEELHEALQ